MTRLQRLASMGLPTLLALLFWIVNSAGVGRRLDEPDMVRAFFWNMLLFAVVMTGLNAAGVAWARHRLRVTEEALGSQGRVALSSILAAFAVAVVGFGCGIGVTAAVVSPGFDSHLWSLFGQGLRLIVPLGLAFSMVGAIAGDLGSNLRGMLAERSSPRMAPGLILMLVVAHLLWAGVAWVALASARGRMPGV
jgi:hypothetical protein